MGGMNKYRVTVHYPNIGPVTFTYRTFEAAAWSVSMASGRGYHVEIEEI